MYIIFLNIILIVFKKKFDINFFFIFLSNKGNPKAFYKIAGVNAERLNGRLI